jgi:hypothetical protein
MNPTLVTVGDGCKAETGCTCVNWSIVVCVVLYSVAGEVKTQVDVSSRPDKILSMLKTAGKAAVNSGPIQHDFG